MIKAIDGINALRTKGAKVRLFYNINTMTISDVEAAAKLGRDLKVSIFYFPTLQIEGYNEKIVMSRQMEKEALHPGHEAKGRRVSGFKS